MKRPRARARGKRKAAEERRSGGEAHRDVHRRREAGVQVVELRGREPRNESEHDEPGCVQPQLDPGHPGDRNTQPTHARSLRAREPSTQDCGSGFTPSLTS